MKPITENEEQVQASMRKALMRKVVESFFPNIKGGKFDVEIERADVSRFLDVLENYCPRVRIRPASLPDLYFDMTAEVPGISFTIIFIDPSVEQPAAEPEVEAVETT